MIDPEPTPQAPPHYVNCQQARALVRALVSAYHSNRSAGGSVDQLILADHRVRAALRDFRLQAQPVPETGPFERATELLLCSSWTPQQTALLTRLLAISAPEPSAPPVYQSRFQVTAPSSPELTVRNPADKDPFEQARALLFGRAWTPTQAAQLHGLVDRFSPPAPAPSSDRPDGDQ